MNELAPRIMRLGPQAPPRDLPSKLTSEAYGVHFGSGGRASGAGTRVARDQGRSGELQDSLGSRNFFRADPDQAGAVAAMSAFTASALSGTRPTGHETRNAVEHMGQARLE